jgi:putative salt-induced outer membrane protein YdiY
MIVNGTRFRRGSDLLVACLVLLAFAGGKVRSQELPPQPEFTVPEELPAQPPPFSELDPAVVDDSPWPSLPVPSYELWSPVDVWLAPKLWDGSVELGLNGTSGNAEAFSVRAGVSALRTIESNELDVNLIYNKASADGAETAHNAILNIRDDVLFSDSPWSLFFVNRIEYDEFRAFDLRYVVNAGLGYRYIDTAASKLVGRIGAGASREFGGPEDRWSPEANFGLDYEHKISDHQKLTATVDYYPEWSDFNDYRLFTDVAWEVLLHEATDMSLKLSAIDQYDSTPNGRKPNDLIYAALLLWKF